MSRLDRRRKKATKTITTNRQLKIRGWRIVIVFSLIIGIFVTVEYISSQKDDQPGEDMQSSDDISIPTSQNESGLIFKNPDLWLNRYNQLIAGYHLRHSQYDDRWWLRFDPKTPSDFALVKKKANEVSVLIQQLASTSEMASRIAVQFQKPIYEFRQGDKISPLTFDFMDRQNKSERSIAVGPGQFPLIFLPQDRTNVLQDSFAFEYRTVLFVRTVECPKAIYVGLLLHELGHLSKSRERIDRKLPDLVDDSPEEIAEEIEMYQFGHQIINAATDNLYNQKMGEIVNRIRPNDWRDLLPQITIADLVELDRVVGAEKYGCYIGDLVGGTHLINIALAVCGQNQLEKERVYRYLVMGL